MCQHCNLSKRTIDHMVTRGEKMLGQDNMRCHNKMKYNIELSEKRFMRVIREKVYEVLQLNVIREKVYEVLQLNCQIFAFASIKDKFIKKRIDTTIKTDIKIKYNKTDIVSHILTTFNRLYIIRFVVNVIGLKHGCKTKIIPYVLIIKYHAKYRKTL
ncbi:hypothetical protein NAPIS_ORF00160, partial [Vairimorpha apis BRL 01]